MRNKKELEEVFNKYEDQMQPEIITDKIVKLSNDLMKEEEVFKKELTVEQVTKFEHILLVENLRNGELCKEVFIWAFALASRLLTAGLD